MAVIACAQTPDDTGRYTFHVVPCTLPACAWLAMFERISTFHLTIILLVTTGERAPTPSLVTTYVVC